MTLSTTIQIIINHETVAAPTPSDHQLKAWITRVLEAHLRAAILSIRLVNEKESAKLNQQYRKKTGPTNILSFCFESPPGVVSDILGDIILCPALIEREVSTQHASYKSDLESYWAHLVVHGCLHLLGYHHDDDIATSEMETLEIEHLEKLGYSNPYADFHDTSTN